MRLLFILLSILIVSEGLCDDARSDLTLERLEPRINLMVEQTPLKRVLNMIVSYSGKKLILDTNLVDTTTLSLSGITWREALKSLQSAHDFEVTETDRLIIISALPARQPIDLPSHGAANPQSKPRPVSTPLIRIAGITGNEQERIAIVEIAGKNQLWKVGSIAPEGYRVSKIDENSITLMHPLSNAKRHISF